MSTSKLDRSDAFQPIKVNTNQTQLTLPTDAVQVRKNGIEFRSPTPIEPWTEMTVDLQSPGENRKLKCNGVVVDCTGNRHSGYSVSMIFMNLSRQSQQRLTMWAADRLFD